MRRLVFTLLLVGGPALASPPGVAFSAPATSETTPPPPPVAWSVAAGVATALVPLAVGGALTVDGSDDKKNAGMVTLMSGLALAPIVSHLIAGEWKRAAIFGALPVASAVLLFVVLAIRPNAVTDQGDATYRLPFGTAVIAGVLSSTVGIVDSFSAADRARARGVGITIAPTVGHQQVGLSIGGSL